MDWTILTSVLGGAVGASVITAFVNWRMKVRDDRSEHARWLRQEKVEIYTNILNFFHEQSKASYKPDTELDEPSFHDAVSDLLTRAHLICSTKMVEQIEQCSLALLETGYESISQTERYEARQEFRQALNKLRTRMFKDLSIG